MRWTRKVTPASTGPACSARHKPRALTPVIRQRRRLVRWWYLGVGAGRIRVHRTLDISALVLAIGIAIDVGVSHRIVLPGRIRWITGAGFIRGKHRHHRAPHARRLRGARPRQAFGSRGNQSLGSGISLSLGMPSPSLGSFQSSGRLRGTTSGRASGSDNRGSSSGAGSAVEGSSSRGSSWKLESVDIVTSPIEVQKAWAVLVGRRPCAGVRAR